MVINFGSPLKRLATKIPNEHEARLTGIFVHESESNTRNELSRARHEQFARANLPHDPRPVPLLLH